MGIPILQRNVGLKMCILVAVVRVEQQVCLDLKFYSMLVPKFC